ncbi:MAG TPA: hypothetical protein VF337_09375 [Candidatus Limnocylindrales bacterium]
MRRVVLLVLASALFVSACGSAKVTDPPAASPSEAQNGSSAAIATPSPTPAAILSIAPSLAAVDGDWIVFAPDGAGFSSKFPETPTLTTQTDKTAVGDAVSSIWTFEQGGNLAYAVLAAAYPAGSLAATTPAKLYDGGINGMAGGSAGYVLSAQTDATLGGHAGRTFLLTSSTGSIKGEIVVVGDTMYMAYVVFTSSVDTSLIDTFLLDFQLSA